MDHALLRGTCLDLVADVALSGRDSGVSFIRPRDTYLGFVSWRVDGDRIRDLRFEGKGCAISVASASLMTEALKGRTRADAQRYFDAVHGLLTRADYTPAMDLGKLAALSGVREFPVRVKCASLCWHTLNAALANQAQSVSTE